MSEHTGNESYSIDPRRVYTPAEISTFAKCSQGFVRKEIRLGHLKAFRLGGKLLRIKGDDAWHWMTKKSESTDSDDSLDLQESSQEDNGAPSGAARQTVADTALTSVLNEKRP